MAKEKDSEAGFEAGFNELFKEDINAILEAYANRAKTGEQAAYIEAVGAALHAFLLYWGRWCYEQSRTCPPGEASDWLENFASHLADLESGAVHPAFETVRSKTLLTSQWLERFHAVWRVELFHAAGIKYRAAARRVISISELRGCSEKDVLSWCAEFRKGRVKNRIAAKLYKDYKEELQNLPIEEIEKQAAEIWEIRNCPVPNS
jgi:hypothetical protein